MRDGPAYSAGMGSSLSRALGGLVCGGAIALLVSQPAIGERVKPNVLLIVIDDQNDWVGPLGGHPQVQT